MALERIVQATQMLVPPQLGPAQDTVETCLHGLAVRGAEDLAELF